MIDIIFVQRVKAWFSYRAALQNSRHEGGIWYRLLKHAHEQASPKPRCRSVAQQFAFENPEVVDTAFAQHHGKGEDLTRTQKMNCRNDLAKSLVNTTYKHLIDDLATRAKETHKQELMEWGLGLGDIGEAEDIQL